MSSTAAPGRPELSHHSLTRIKPAEVIWRCLRAMTEARSSWRLVLPPDRPLLRIAGVASSYTYALSWMSPTLAAIVNLAL